MVNREIFLDAVFLWMIPLEAVLEMVEIVPFNNACAFAASFSSIAVSAVFTFVFMRDLKFLLRIRRFLFCLSLFIADL